MKQKQPSNAITPLSIIVHTALTRNGSLGSPVLNEDATALIGISIGWSKDGSTSYTLAWHHVEECLLDAKLVYSRWLADCKRTDIPNKMP